jgi:sugar lactone lactonase YvrE
MKIALSFPIARFRVVAFALFMSAVQPRLPAQTATFVNAQTSLGSGFSQPTGLAVDSAGDLFVVDNTGSQVVRIDAVTGAQTTIGSGLKNPTSVALDSAGDVFIADGGNNRVVVVPPDGGPQLTVGVSGLETPVQVALDSAGNLYIVDNGNGQVVKVWANGSAPTAVATGLADPQGVAIDSAGNVYISENSAEAVIKVAPGGGSPTTVLSGFIPTQLAVDAAGDLFVGGDGGVMELPAGSATPVNAASGLGGYALGVAVDREGRLYVSLAQQATVTEIFTSSVDFGKVPLCSPGQQTAAGCFLTLSLTFSLTGNEADVSPQGVFTLGAPNSDFVQAAGTTCGFDTDNPLCTVNITFTPSLPGLRQGAVQLGDEHANILATVNLAGTGVGPEIGFITTSQTILGSGLNKPSAVAMDGAGNVYIADTFNNRIVKLPAGGGAQTTVGTGLSLPSGIAIDGAGDVIVAQVGAGSLTVIPTRVGGPSSIGGGLSAPAGVAVNGLGDIFVADGNNNRIVKLPANGGAQTTVGTELSGPIGVAVDAAGDVFIADTGNSRIVEVPADGSAQLTIGSGFSHPQGVAVDAAGDVFVSDSGNNRIVELPAGGGVQIALVEGLNTPLGIVVDGHGNVFFADSLNNRVVELPFSVPPSHKFASTEVGHTSADSPYSLLVESIGNQPLNLGEVVYPADFPVDFDESGIELCLGGTNLVPGQICELAANFTPLNPGPLSEALAIDDNSLSPFGAAQIILLSGTAQLGQSIVFLPPSSVTFGAAPMNLSKDAAATSGLAVSFKIVSGPATLKGTVVTFTGAGSVAIEAMQAGDSSYLAASSVKKTIIVAKAMPAIAWPTPKSIVYGTKLGPSQLDARSPVAGKFVYTPDAGTVLAVGSYNLSVTFTPTSAADYVDAKATVTIEVTKAVLTVTARNLSVAKGSPIPKLTATYTGFVNGDTAKVLSGAPTLSTNATSSSPVGTYTIIVKQGTLTAKSYTFKLVDGHLKITAPAAKNTNGQSTSPLPPRVPPPASSPGRS